MIPSNLKNAISLVVSRLNNRSNAQKHAQNVVYFPWDPHKGTFFTENQNDKNTISQLQIEGKDLNEIIKGLQRSRYWDPTMKNVVSCFKVTFWMMLIALAIGAAAVIFLVIPGDISSKDLCLYGLCSFLMFLLIASILGIIMVKADNDLMINREIEFNRTIQELNVKHFIPKGLVWKVGPLGSYLAVQRVGRGSVCPPGIYEVLAKPEDRDGGEKKRVNWGAFQDVHQPFCGPLSHFIRIQGLRCRINRFYMHSRVEEIANVPKRNRKKVFSKKVAKKDVVVKAVMKKESLRRRETKIADPGVKTRIRSIR